MWITIIFMLIKFFIFAVLPFIFVMIFSPTNQSSNVNDVGDWITTTLGCNPFTDNSCSIISSDTCIGCDILSRTFEIFSTHATYAIDFLSKMSLELLLIFFVLWTVWYTFETLLKADDDKITAESYLSKIIGKAGKLVLVAFVLGAFTSSNFVKPIARGYSESIVKIGSVISLKVFNLDSKVCDNYKSEDVKDEGVFSNEMKKDFLCYVSSVSLLMMAGMQGGGQIMSIGLDTFNFFQMIAGYWIFLAFFFLAVYLFFELFDILLSILIPVFALPILFMTWVFDRTQKWIYDIAINSIVNVALYMITLSISFVIVYGVYTHIGDRFYPGPMDGYSYIFPDFFTNNLTPEGKKAKEEHRLCIELLNKDKNKSWNFKSNTATMSPQVLKCNENMPTPITSLGLMSLMMILALSKLTQKIFEYIKKEIGLGGTLIIGSGGLMRSTLKTVLGKAKDTLSFALDFAQKKVMKK